MFQRKAVSSLLAFLAINAIVGAYGSPLFWSSDSSQAVADGQRAQEPKPNFWNAMGDKWNDMVNAAEEKIKDAKNFVEKMKETIQKAIADKIAEAQRNWEQLKSKIIENLTTLDENLVKLEAAVEEESEASQEIIQEIANKVKEVIDEIKDRLISVLGILGDQAIEHITDGAEEYKKLIDEGVVAVKDGKANANQNVIDVIRQIRDAIQELIDHLDNIWPSDTTATAEVRSTCSA